MWRRSTLAALRSFFPFFSVLRYYSLRRDLLRDVVVGLTVCVMQIPQGMAYGLLAGLDPVFGLYVSLLPVLVYFFLGTSKHISVGVFDILPLIARTLARTARRVPFGNTVTMGKSLQDLAI